MAGYEVPIVLARIAVAGLAVANNARSATPYAFLMAKTRAWEARMLSDAKMESLAESSSIESLISELRGTDYESDLEGAGNAEEVELSVNHHLFRIYRELLGLVPKRCASFVRKFSERLELGNLKLVIQAVSGGVDRDLAMAYLSDGMVFSRERLEVMAKAEDIEELIRQLSETEYYRELERYLEPGEYEASELVRAVEHSYYMSLWRRAEGMGRRNRKIARTIVGREIDLANLKLILRLNVVGAEPDIIMKNIIPIEADLKLETLRMCAQADSIEGVKTIVSNSPLKSVLVPLLSPTGDDVAEIEKLFDESLLNFCKVMSLFKPLTIATPLAYLYEKHAEVRNLRTASRGVGDGIPSGELKKILLRSARVE